MTTLEPLWDSGQVSLLLVVLSSCYIALICFNHRSESHKWWLDVTTEQKKMRFVTLRQHALNNLALKRELHTFRLKLLPLLDSFGFLNQWIKRNMRSSPPTSVFVHATVSGSSTGVLQTLGSFFSIWRVGQVHRLRASCPRCSPSGTFSFWPLLCGHTDAQSQNVMNRSLRPVQHYSSKELSIFTSNSLFSNAWDIRCVHALVAMPMQIQMHIQTQIQT